MELWNYPLTNAELAVRSQWIIPLSRNSTIPQLYVYDLMNPSEEEQFVEKCKEHLMAQMHTQPAGRAKINRTRLIYAILLSSCGRGATLVCVTCGGLWFAATPSGVPMGEIQRTGKQCSINATRRSRKIRPIF